jgi:hypothetical protein
MSLLSICQSVCDEIGFPRPSSIAANPDQLARQLFALANKELSELSKAKPWPELERVVSINTVPGTDTYNIADDFGSMIPGTGYTLSEGRYTFLGSITAKEWRLRKLQLINPAQRYAFRLMRASNTLIIDPVPKDIGDGTGPVFFLEYITRYFAQDSTFSVLKPKYVVDEDVSLVSEELVQMGLMWRIKHAKGLEFSADKDEYESAVDREYAKAIDLPDVQVGYPRPGSYDGLDPLWVPETGYGAALV